MEQADNDNNNLEKRIIKIMNKYRKGQKIFNLYLPVWFVLVIVVVCIATGIFIGSKINKTDGSLQSKESTSAIEDSGANQDSTSSTQPEIDKSQWNLILVNKWNPMPENYSPTLKQLENGHAVDERCYSDLLKMMDDCRNAGLNPLICSSYRTQEKQEELFKRQTDKWIVQGYSQEDAKVQAAKLVAIPGTSEHQLGLAVDIVDVANQNLDESQEKTQVQKWLINNSYKYGWILRYPNEKSEITGINYEPWHYRYVGKKAAKEIYDADICLEEYLSKSTA